MTLRQKVIEAMAKAWVAYEGDDWEDLNGRPMAAVKACVERELDAMLDCLTENRNKWVGQVINDGERVTPESLLAVLREDR